MLCAQLTGTLTYVTPVMLAVLFATAIVYFVRRSRGGGFTSPGRPPVDR